jgi:hypothetical protein
MVSRLQSPAMNRRRLPLTFSPDVVGGLAVKAQQSGAGWGSWGFWSERLFDSLDEARACRDQLNAELADDNPSSIDPGEHWGSSTARCAPKSSA